MSDPAIGAEKNRSAFYRPARRRAREFFSKDAECAFLCDGVKHPILDLSASGFLFAAVNGHTWDPGTEVEGQLILHGEPVLDSRFRVARVEAYPTGPRVGVDAQQTIALAKMLELDAERSLRRELQRGPSAYKELLPADYLAAVSAISEFLLFYRPLLDREEQRLLTKPDGPAKVRALVEESFETLRARWRELVINASKAGWKLREDRKGTLRGQAIYRSNHHASASRLPAHQSHVEQALGLRRRLPRDGVLLPRRVRRRHGL